MKTHALTLTSLLALGSCVGCYAGPEGAHRAASAASELTFDTRGIAVAPPATIPADRLTLASFQDAAITRGLLRTTERFTRSSTLGRRVNQESASWHLETDATTGQVFASRTLPEGAPVRVDEAQLQADAVALLDGWGLHAGERARVLQRRLMLRGEELGEVAPEVTTFRYKTFVLRGVNGVPVEGHRAVITRARDGATRRVFLNWPPLASEGHRLRTALRTEEIVRRATDALRAAGETAGEVRLRWKYVPTQLATGEVALTLTVGARLAGAVNADGETQEAREIDVDVVSP